MWTQSGCPIHQRAKTGMERFNSTLQRFEIKDKDKSNKFYLETAQNIE